jgi:hypothetical protein
MKNYDYRHHSSYQTEFSSLEELIEYIRPRLKSVMTKYPTLCSDGFLYPGYSDESYSDKLEESRKELIEKIEEVAYSYMWSLATLVPVHYASRYPKFHGYSYTLKHCAEKKYPKGYIANGELIAGMIIAGFEVQYNKERINAYFNIDSAQEDRMYEDCNKGMKYRLDFGLFKPRPQKITEVKP